MNARLRHLLIVLATMFVVLTILWWGIWSAAAGQYRRVIDGWIDSGRAAGYTINYDDRSLFGFPRHVTFRFTNVQWKNTDNILFHADDIDIAATPGQWRTFDTKFKNHVQITAPIDDTGQDLILGGEDGRAHVVLDEDGVWKFSRISLTNAKVGRTPDYLFLAEKLQASATRPDTPPKDAHESGLALMGSAENITLPANMPSPFGVKMAKCDVDVRVMGAVPDFRERKSVELWNKAMGVAQFDKLNMEWGPLVMQSKGAVGFDDDLQPEGVIAATIAAPEKILKALMEHGFIPPQQENMLSSALSFFAKPAAADNNSGIEVPITVQLSGLFFGPVKIFTFPEIEWPQPAPALAAAAHQAP